MSSTNWEKQHIYFQRIVWAISAITSTLLMIVLLLLRFGIEVASIAFFVTFFLMRVLLPFILKNRFANSMVRVLKFNYEEIERDFQIVFKKKHIQNYRKDEEESYRYEFPGRGMSMTVQPHWTSLEAGVGQQSTKITLYELTAKNEAFARMLAESIDEMANQRASA